jgi:hypothetical protein
MPKANLPRTQSIEWQKGAMEYGEWQDWLLCVFLSSLLFMAATVHMSLERIRVLLSSLSPLRKVFGVLSLLAIPYMVTVGFGEQTGSAMNPDAPIYWFTAAAVNAVIFFWVCEELITPRPLLKNTFLIVVGALVALALRHQVNWVMTMAAEAATKVETEEARDCKGDVMTRKLYSALTTPTTEPPDLPKHNSYTAKAAQVDERPTTLTAKFYNPQSPTIVASNRSGEVTESVHYSMILFRSSDLQFFSFTTQDIGYIKPHSNSAPYLMENVPRFADANGQINDGDELTGSVAVDCPKCAIQTYIVHFVWKRTGWFYESQQKAGYLLPKDMSQDGRSKYIQLLTSNVLAKERNEIAPMPPP